MAADPAILDVLVWYVEHGEANSDDAVDLSNAERELTTINDLLDSAGRLHMRGMNGARGYAAEALGSVIWHLPEVIGTAWEVLERRASEEPLLSVRCCLMRPVVPLFNDDRQRCAALAERLSCPPAWRNARAAWIPRKSLALVCFSIRAPAATYQLGINLLQQIS